MSDSTEITILFGLLALGALVIAQQFYEFAREVRHEQAEREIAHARDRARMLAQSERADATCQVCVRQTSQVGARVEDVLHKVECLGHAVGEVARRVTDKAD